ncbi:MAG: division/cell wall cluster transcriptional repressor MraZ [Anaerolineales bacterium]
MFLGQYFHSLDQKGRLTIPAKYREVLRGEVIITKGFDLNLLVMPLEVFESWANQINDQNYADPNARLLRRYLFSNGEQAEVDRSGRILIPQYLREKANLNSEIVIVGVGSFFEIWSKENWEQHKLVLDEAESDVARFIDFQLTTNRSRA